SRAGRTVLRRSPDEFFTRCPTTGSMRPAQGSGGGDDTGITITHGADALFQCAQILGAQTREYAVVKFRACHHQTSHDLGALGSGVDTADTVIVRILRAYGHALGHETVDDTGHRRHRHAE